MIELGEICRAGPLVLAALSERAVGRGPGTSIAFYGAKRPVAILMRGETKTTVYGIDGNPITPEALELRFPGQIAAFERAVDGAGAGR
ncbi:MAG TPA: hypothetical protein VLA52_03265 [Thermohalobaculum sp.]|nr:hypothetical protein [Thermohalobaculum sp.]